VTITATTVTTYAPIIPTIVTTQGQGEYFWRSGLLVQKSTPTPPKTPSTFRYWRSDTFGGLAGFCGGLVMIVTNITIIGAKK